MFLLADARSSTISGDKNMIDKGNKSEQKFDLFEDKVMKFPGISPSAGYEMLLEWLEEQNGDVR